MICEECKRQGKESRVTEGSSSMPLVYYPVQYDEKGNRIESGRNKTTTQYSCSNGHTWAKTQ